METIYLKYFTTLYETENLHKAAGRLYISQQGLSRAIQKMEAELKVPLFMRDYSGMHPTPEAKAFYRTAVNISRELELAKKEVIRISQDSQKISIIASYGVMHLLFDKVSDFTEQKKIKVQWEEYPDIICENMISAREANIGLTVLDNETSVESKELVSQNVMLLVPVSHPLASRKEVHIEDLKGENLICGGKGFFIFSQLQRKCLEKGFYPQIAATTNEIDLCHKLVEKNAGLGITVDFIAEMVTLNGIIAVPFSPDEWQWRAGAICRDPEGLDDREKKFWDYITCVTSQNAEHLSHKG